MSKSLLFLLDGMALAYRSHFAFINSNLRNGEGIPTGPILGFANTLEKMLEEQQPSHIAVVWDTDAPTFRHEMDEEYKANRPPQPEELTVGIPLIKEMIDGYGIKNIEQDGYEADDIIGTIADRANAEDVDVFLVTPDKDFMQLVHDHIKMMKPDNQNGGFNIIDREGVKEYFGVYPENVVDVLAMLGDTSDNIPGVRGIGKKGAPKIIRNYGSLEKAIEVAPDIKSTRYGNALDEQAEQALHAKKMVTIKTDVPDIVDWEVLNWDGPDTETLGKFFKRMEFRSLTKKYLGEEVKRWVDRDVSDKNKNQGDLFVPHEVESEGDSEFASYTEDKVSYQMVSQEEELENLVDKLIDKESLCFDTETSGTDPMKDRLVGVSLSTSAGEGYYVPVGVEDGISLEKGLKLLQPLFGNEKSLKIAHNFKFDYMILNRAGLEIEGPAFDTMIAAYLIDASQKLKMDALAKKYLKYETIPIEELIGKGRKQKSMDELPSEKIKVYACEDADITWQLHKVLKEILERDELEEIAETLEFPLMEVLAKMEMYGIRLDVEMLNEFSETLRQDLQDLEQQVFEKAEMEFNINSPQQLGEVLFDKMGLPAGKKTKTGQYSTSESVLSKLEAEYEMPGLILEYRALSKLRSTYVDALPKLINEETGRIHTDFNQHVAATGRLSSSNPNLQNIPIRTKRGREIRKAFIADKGFKLLSADYSQVELRVIASISEDENMIEAFKNNEDIHARTAKEVFDLESLDNVTGNQRRKAKEVNFGIPYGVSSYGLANRLGIENSEGKEMIDQYFERFPGILRYINETKQFAKENGYVKTLLGRRRYIPDINASNWNRRSFAERTAINTPIQGTAADIIKLAMINIQEYLEENDLKTRMLLQVHDELIFEVPEEEQETVPAKLKELMETAYELAVPLKVDMGLADNWLDAH
ncbi:DNA polymerase I [Aliifodinibius sp. S!AR15-10]|uniref:DNA polymerase I n=1 Tax=Aliifodinibius sp. S!AR15-10 TaxID=2950437 RepID=UPI0028627CB2|nr:DNA polymerase I [Aliifodinibius sp. S!AR15-10]MDR8390165.1 DNA polymerase I [Aliifodinibius sp. S!AR15-10]